MIGKLLCYIGIHQRTFTVYWEHGIIDGPPRQFARVTCTRCGESRISRDSLDCKRAARSLEAFPK